MTWLFRKKRKPPNPILVGTPSINIIKQAEAKDTPPPIRNNRIAPTTITTTKHGGGILIKVEITITGKGFLMFWAMLNNKYSFTHMSNYAQPRRNADC